MRITCKVFTCLLPAVIFFAGCDKDEDGGPEQNADFSGKSVKSLEISTTSENNESEKATFEFRYDNLGRISDLLFKLYYSYSGQEDLLAISYDFRYSYSAGKVDVDAFSDIGENGMLDAPVQVMKLEASLDDKGRVEVAGYTEAFEDGKQTSDELVQTYYTYDLSGRLVSSGHMEDGEIVTDRSYVWESGNLLKVNTSDGEEIQKYCYTSTNDNSRIDFNCLLSDFDYERTILQIAGLMGERSSDYALPTEWCDVVSPDAYSLETDADGDLVRLSGKDSGQSVTVSVEYQ